MRRALFAAGAVLILTAPAFADQLTIEKRTITRETPASGSTVSTEIIAPDPPPPPQAEVPPPPPGPGVAWIPGHWGWQPAGHTYAWVHGSYREPPRAEAHWVPGRFVERNDGWMWEDGRWD